MTTAGVDVPEEIKPRVLPYFQKVLSQNISQIETSYAVKEIAWIYGPVGHDRELVDAPCTSYTYGKRLFIEA